MPSATQEGVVTNMGGLVVAHPGGASLAGLAHGGGATQGVDTQGVGGTGHVTDLAETALPPGVPPQIKGTRAIASASPFS